MNDNEQTPNANVEAIPAPDQKDEAASAENKGHNGNPAQSAGRVTAQEQNDAPDATIAFEGEEAKHIP
jgi:hypothetical protein